MTATRGQWQSYIFLFIFDEKARENPWVTKGVGGGGGTGGGFSLYIVFMFDINNCRCKVRGGREEGRGRQQW